MKHLIALAAWLLTGPAMAAPLETLGDWKAADDGAHASFSFNLAQKMGARAPSIFADDVGRCLDKKAEELPPDTHLGKVIEDCVEPVPTEAEILASHTVAVKLSKAAGYKLNVFTTDDGPANEWFSRAVSGEEPRAQHTTVKALKAKAIATGTPAAEIIDAMKSRPTWVFAAPADGEYWLSWFDGNCHPIEFRVDRDGRYTGIGNFGLCSPPGLSYTVDSLPEDEASCELHPEIKYCSKK